MVELGFEPSLSDPKARKNKEGMERGKEKEKKEIYIYAEYYSGILLGDLTTQRSRTQ